MAHDAPPRGPERPAPSYDADKEDYAGISSGTLESIEDLRDARAFAEMVVDTVREGLLVLDLDLRVVAANESFYQTFGVEPEATVGRLVYDLGDGQWDVPELRELLEDVLPQDHAFDDYEVDHEFEGVGRRVMVLNGRQMNDHDLVLLAIEDATERRRAERALREAEERFELFAENAREYAVIGMDAEARVTTWGRGAERVLGWTREEAVGRPGAMIFTEEDRAAGAPERELEAARAGGSALDERWHVRKDGARFWGTGVLVALRDGGVRDGSVRDGSVRGFAKVLRDNTRRKEAEDALRRVNETLEEQVAARTAQVRSLSRALLLAEQEERRRLAYVLHDDLQQVLHGALIQVEVGRTDRVEALLGDAIRTARTLSHELAPPILRGRGLGELLAWVAERERALYGLEVEHDGSDVEVADEEVRVLLYGLLRELLFNVAKHAGVDRARVWAEPCDGGVRVVVEDEGAGFDPSALGEPRHGGLGLASVRERLEAVGGRLAVASAPGEGTRVAVEVPSGEGPSGEGTGARARGA